MRKSTGETKPHEIQIKRIYEPAAPADGRRVLVDRIWPRGVSKERAAIAEWRKEIAPTTDLRVWFGHDPDRWPEFKKRYRAELRDQTVWLDHLLELATQQTLTLVFSATDEKRNQAIVLCDVLRKRQQATL